MMETNSLNDPCRIFVIYARDDKSYLDDMIKHLKMLENKQIIKVWHDQYIDPGQRWEKEIVRNLDESEIILILVSPDYYMSEYIQKNEIVRAVQKHKAGDAIVIPIFVRHCAWKEDDVISALQGLPDDDKPLADYDTNAREKIYVQTILEKIKSVADQVKETRKRKQREREVEIERKNHEEEQGREKAAWESVLKSNIIPAYRAYLSEYPTGTYCKEATDWLRRLEYDEIRKKEDHTWSEAIALHLPEAYQHYLEQYPDGIYKNIAHFRQGVVKPEPPPNPRDSTIRLLMLLGVGVACFTFGAFFTKIILLPTGPDPTVSAWKNAKQKSTIYAYQSYLIHHPTGTEQKKEALDSLAKLEKIRKEALEDGIYFYENGDSARAKSSFLKVYAIDSFNTTMLNYLDTLGVKIQ